MRSYKDLTSKIDCANVDTLRETVRDKSWFSASVIAGQILKSIDMEMWEKAVRAGAQISKESGGIEQIDSLLDTWTNDLAIIIPGILSELKEAFDPSAEDGNATLLLDLLARATVIISTILAMLEDLDKANEQSKEYDPKEYEDES